MPANTPALLVETLKSVQSLQSGQEVAKHKF